tara:strand:- start:1710 stop:2843 length:1134 start_codon:yes stop_codon:yes gene_type:complete
MIIGIDASNINSGGGITHLTSLIDEITEKDGIYIKIWAPASTLIRIKDAFFIEKFNNYFLNKNIFFRFFFQIFILSRELKKNKCNILFVPGGTYLGSFKPFVTMCRNMLPFEKKERDRYKYSLMYFKLLFLRVVQLKTFKKANGVIFLSNYAQQTIFDLIPKNTLFKKKTEIIPHGINKKFFFNRKVNVLSFKDRSVIKCVYTSTIDKYKHQNNVIKAVSNLRAKNYKFELNLIGSSSVAELNKLKKLLKKNDPKKKFIFYQGALDTDEIIKIYKDTNLFIYGSTCENLPNILLEKMATRIPIISSKKEPMKEVLKNGGIYFDAESVLSIEQALLQTINLDQKLYNKAEIANSLVANLDWNVTTNKTLGFLRKFAIK